MIAIIRQAFAGSVYPPGAKVTNCSRQNCDECNEIAREFDGKTWSSLTDVKYLRYYESALSLMTPEARRYYLPAFMIAALTDPVSADVILDGLEFGFTPPETEGAEAEEWFAKFGQTQMEYFLNRNSGFTPAQKQAIKAYLEFEFHDEPESYWAYFPEKLQERKNVLDFWDTFAD